MTRLVPQELRTFFISASAAGHRSLFQTNNMAALLKQTLLDHREKKRFALHAFVVMPDHLHDLFTPASDVPLEKAVQYIKGGFSFRAGKELGVTREIWQRSYMEHRIKDVEDYQNHVLYIHQNPVKAGLVAKAEEYPWSSVNMELDPMPEHFLQS